MNLENELTIVVPVYNEEDNMERLESELSKYLQISKLKSCVLFVDDGSTDNSMMKIKEICNRNKNFNYVALRKNSGLSSALKAGIDMAKSEYIGYIDADLQTNPEDFNLLISYIKENALVTGVRANRKDKLGKRLQSKLANGLRKSFTHDGATDTGCPLKIMKTANAKKIPFFNGIHRFLPAMIMLQGASYKEIPVRHYPRQAGVSKYNMWNRLVGPLVDCMAYKWMKSRYINYDIKESNIDK